MSGIGEATEAALADVIAEIGNRRTRQLMENVPMAKLKIGEPIVQAVGDCRLSGIPVKIKLVIEDAPFREIQLVKG